MIINHNSKITGDCRFFKFLRRIVAGKHLMRFLKTWFSNFSGVAWWFLLHFIILILYVVCVCRLVHGAALTSSTVSTLKYCLLWHSKFCPSCLHCQPVLHDLCLKDERSTWSGHVASLSPWTLVKYDFYYIDNKKFICPVQWLVYMASFLTVRLVLQRWECQYSLNPTLHSLLLFWLN